MRPVSCRAVLRTPGAAAFFLAAAPGRVGIAMSGLGIVWLVHDRTGSYATAGLVTGGFAVAEALVGPQLARLVDRFGQTRVLPPALLAHAVAVAALLTLVTAGRPSWLMAAGGTLVGATIPQLGALSAAPRTQLVVLTAVLAAGCLPLLAVDSLPLLGLALTLTGMVVPPILVLFPRRLRRSRRRNRHHDGPGSPAPRSCQCQAWL